MYRAIRSGELQPSPGGTVTFEGDPYGSGVSFFLVDNVPGAGPDLHKHPYSETWTSGLAGRGLPRTAKTSMQGRATSWWSARHSAQVQERR
jgi:hypothetical protein